MAGLELVVLMTSGGGPDMIGVTQRLGGGGGGVCSCRECERLAADDTSLLNEWICMGSSIYENRYLCINKEVNTMMLRHS